MAHYSVYRNDNPRTRADFPLLVDVQADLLAALRTRVVVPLVRLSDTPMQPIDRLTPIVEVNGERYLLLAPQLAGVPAATLGTPVASLASQREAIVAALDLLLTGA